MLSSAEATGDRRMIATKKSEYIHAFASRPNIHQALHFRRFRQEYASLWNSTVLQFEDKYKAFKALNAVGNLSIDEKTFLYHENVDQTIRLLIGGSHDYEEHEAAEVLKYIHCICPNLINRFLPPTSRIVSVDNIISDISIPGFLQLLYDMRIRDVECKALSLPTSYTALDQHDNKWG
jgi:hypothetical protein